MGALELGCEKVFRYSCSLVKLTLYYKIGFVCLARHIPKQKKTAAVSGLYQKVGQMSDDAILALIQSGAKCFCGCLMDVVFAKAINFPIMSLTCRRSSIGRATAS